MRLWMLGSGSRGNAVLLESGAARVLVDAGFPPRVLQSRLAAARIAPESIQACVVTHEHTDHVKGVTASAAKWGWRVYASEGTVRGHAPLAESAVRTFRAGDTIDVDGFALATVATPHDALESVALVATATACGTRVGICYDLGYVPDAVREALRGLDMLVLEANHDEPMLRAGPYPPSVCDRIAGRHGHLSNAAAAALARAVAYPGLRHVVLAHLSEKCNEPRLATATVTEGLARTRFRGAVTPSSQDAVLGPIVAHGGPATPRVRAEQLALGL